MNRGDILIGSFPHADGSNPKERPVLVVQSDDYNRRIRNVIVATITSNLARLDDPAHYLIDVATADGAGTGIPMTSLVSCLNLSVIPRQALGRRIGRLTQAQMEGIDQCLRKALGLSD